MTLFIIGHPTFLREALSNLVHNAIRYTPAGDHIAVRAAVDGDTALVYVDDTGSGMSAERRAHTLQYFRHAHEGGSRQGKPKGVPKGARCITKGSGLGLAIACAYVAHSGRHIKLADGEPNTHNGVGLSARVRIPLARATASIEHAAMQQPQ